MVFIVLRHERRRVVHFGVTAHPTAAWVAQQITEAFPWDSAPRYVTRDRDSVTGALVRARIKAMGIEDVMTATRSPWRNPFVKRMIGSIRRECLDHLIVIDERHLRRILASYLDYCHRSRTHLSLGKDSPFPRPVESAKAGEVIALPGIPLFGSTGEPLDGNLVVLRDHLSQPQASESIMSAIRSPIIIAGKFRLARGISVIKELSATLRPPKPRTRPLGSVTTIGSSVLPIRQVPAACQTPVAVRFT